MVAVAATVLAVKLMDDVLDAPRDRVRGQPNWAQGLGRATTPYALLCLVVGAAVHSTTTVSLFLAAYGWGMVGDRGAVMPSGLKGWQESALAIALSVEATGIAATVFALTLVGAAHLADEWLDRPASAVASGRIVGAGPPALLPVLVLLLTLCGLLLQPLLFVWGAVVSGTVMLLTRPRTGHRQPGHDGSAAVPAGDSVGDPAGGGGGVGPWSW